VLPACTHAIVQTTPNNEHQINDTNRYEVDVYLAGHCVQVRVDNLYALQTSQGHGVYKDAHRGRYAEPGRKMLDDHDTHIYIQTSILYGILNMLTCKMEI
jgi:hypothetical protein